MRILLIVAAGLAVCGGIMASETARQPADWDDYTRRITEELRARDPEAAKIFEQANTARDEKHDLAAAEQLYRQVLQKQPDWTHARRRLASVVLELGRRPEAIQLARQALENADIPENKGALITILVRSNNKNSVPTAAEIAEAARLGRDLLNDPANDAFPLMAACEAAVAANDLPMLKLAASRLEHAKPVMPVRFYYAWQAALSEHDFNKAEEYIRAAEKAGFPPAATDQMRKVTAGVRPWWERLWKFAWPVLAVWFGTFALLLLAGVVLSAMALRSSERIARAPAGQEVEASRLIARIYRAVLWASCAFYYLSMPLVLALVVALPVAVIYGCLAAGRIPVKLLLVLVVIALVTIWSVIKSLLVRGRDQDPGDKLDLSKQPRFRRLLLDVAKRLDTRPVDNVYLTPGTEVAVVERGSLRRQMANQSERCLILGLGVLNGMRIGALRAVLAHEYGHFINRDTSGGGFALAVRRSFMTMAMHLAAGGAATWMNPAWLFLNGFYRVFIRISHGASRLQEVLADRWAAMTAGGAAFEEGLRHVIARSVRFAAHAALTLKEVIDAHKSLANLYQFVPGQPADEASIQRDIEKALNAKPTGYDSHPSPQQRFAWVRACNAKVTPDSGDEAEAWSLFENREALERQMTEVVRAGVAAHNGIKIPAGDA